MLTLRAVVGLVALAATANAGQATAPKTEKARQIVRAADAAMRKIEAFSYTARTEGIGLYGARAPIGEAVVTLLKNPQDKAFPVKVVSRGTYWRPGMADPVSFNVAFDGKTFRSLNQADKVMIQGNPDNHEWMAMIPGFYMFLPREFTDPAPFETESNAPAVDLPVVDLRGQVVVGGVLCNAIYFEYGPKYGNYKSQWYFGVEDNLPRRVEHLFENGGRFGATVLTLSDLNIHPRLSGSSFVLQTPSGFTVKPYEPPPRSPELLPVGEAAPNWSLKDSSGTVHKLSDYRGKVVLMDFWATWCGGCKFSMHGAQELHEKFANRNVTVIGVNTWEKTKGGDFAGDPVKYMKSHDYTYSLLLNGDDVAKEYRVRGIPTFYLIGVDGKIIHREVGYNADEGEKKLAAIIEKYLKAHGM